MNFTSLNFVDKKYNKKYLIKSYERDSLVGINH